MPLGSFGSPLGSGASLPDVLDALARLQKEVTYLLNGGLDTLNVNELSADVINAGTLNAALVTVKAALNTLAFIQLSATGLVINNGTENTFIADTDGNVTMKGIIEAIGGIIGGFTIMSNKLSGGTDGLIEGGTISGAQINGGNISVSSDVTIGNKLHMNASNFGNGIDWGGIEIYIDPAAGTLHLVASGGIYANGVLIA